MPVLPSQNKKSPEQQLLEIEELMRQELTNGQNRTPWLQYKKWRVEKSRKKGDSELTLAQLEFREYQRKETQDSIAAIENGGKMIGEDVSEIAIS